MDALRALPEEPERRLLRDGVSADVWWLPLDGVTRSRLRDLRALLPAEERLRADTFRDSRGGHRFAVRRALLRLVLSRYVGAEPNELRFARGDAGKPALVPGQASPSLRFNASHSDGLAVVAVSGCAEVGIDVERVRPDLEVDGIVRRYFSTEEALQLSLVPPARRLEAFFAAWTLKESYCKALGTGLRTDLRSFTVPIPCTEPAAVLRTGSPEPLPGCRALTLPAPAGYAAGIALAGSGVHARRR